MTVGDIGIAGDGTGKLREDNVVKRGTRPERYINQNFTLPQDVTRQNILGVPKALNISITWPIH